ncbi:MAG: hypothetical protein AB8B77_06305 [Alphaproteobacteria bacterium]
MSTNPISLTLGQRTQVFTLKEIDALSQRTQERLTSGREINNVKDDAFGYFQAKTLSDRAEEFFYRKDKIDQGISTITAALQGLDSIEDMLLQMKGIVEATKTQTATERMSSTEQFLSIGDQISRLVDDASYNGINLLTKVNLQLDVDFSERTTSRLTVHGFDLNSTSANDERGLFTSAAFLSNGDFAAFSTVLEGAATINFDDGSSVDATGFSAIGDNNSGVALAEQVLRVLDDAISRSRAAAQEMANSVNILQIRLDYTSEYIDNLEGGSDKITLADINQEGANMVALQTRYEIGLEALSVSGDQQRQLIRLIQ